MQGGAYSLQPFFLRHGAWLGHASLETTNRYAEITLRTKQAALEKCALPTATDDKIPRKPSWHADVMLLDWLKAL